MCGYAPVGDSQPEFGMSVPVCQSAANINIGTFLVLDYMSEKSPKIIRKLTQAFQDWFGACQPAWCPI